MDRKTKLAKLILLESEGIQGAEGITNTITLAQELHKDAIELAKLILQEDERKAS
jgi:hypothetical protein